MTSFDDGNDFVEKYLIHGEGLVHGGIFLLLNILKMKEENNTYTII
jgi:hypothetical protein